jgi:hypothetical protein
MIDQFQPGEAMQFMGGPPVPLTQNFYQKLVGLGLGTNLKLCLDAGAAASYPGSGQSWLDLAGSGYDFFLGAGSGASSDDPTFNGVAGALSANEYFSFDSDDLFRYDSANEAWMNNLHKDSCQWAFVALFYIGSLAATQGLLGNTAASNASVGVDLTVQTSGVPQINVRNGSGSAAAATESPTSGFPLSAGAWQFLAMSVDEASATGNMNWNVNGNQDTDDVAFSSPSASDATFTLEIAARGSINAELSSGSRMACFAMWEGRHLTHSEIDSVFQAIRGRVGI